MNELGPLPKARPDDVDGGKIMISTEVLIHDLQCMTSWSCFSHVVTCLLVTTAVKSLKS